MKKIKISELVLPGGDLHRVGIALEYGADAVYVGLSIHSLRKSEVDFTVSGIKKAIDLAHKSGKKIYVTFNIFAHEDQLSNIKRDLRKIAELNPDAFIISDPGIIHLAKELALNIPIHLSTQANTLNSESVKFWQEQGVKRIVLARETSLADIKKIKKSVPNMELEVFVHGAMCISYSGRCLLSSYMTGRSANLGACAQPCRWEYRLIQKTKYKIQKIDNSKINRKSKLENQNSRFFLEEASRPGEYFELIEDSHGSYVMSSKDLCLIEHLDKLAEAGVDALKIEGRNKTDYYVAVTAKTYRRALNLYKKDKFTKKEKTVLKKELEQLAHRDYTTGFLFGEAKTGPTYNSRQPIYGKKYVGFVEKIHTDNWCTVIVKNKIESGKIYELVSSNDNFVFRVAKIKDGSKTIESISPGEKDKRVIIESDKKLIKNSFFREA